MALALIGLGLLAAQARAAERRRALLVVGLAVAGFIVSLALVLGGADTLITRNVIALLLPAAMVVAAGLAAARPRWLGLVIALALCAIGIIATVGVAADRSLQRPDWRAVARTLGGRSVPGPQRAILIQNYRTLLPLSLYLPHLKKLGAPGARVRELDVISISSPQQPLCWWGAACNLTPSQLQASYAIPGFHLLWRRRVRQFTIMRLASDRTVWLTRAAVGSALRTTRLRRDDLLLQRR